MGLTKEDAIKQLGSSSNQQALVNKIMGTKIIKPSHHVIPAGKTMMTDLSAEQLKEAIYNWFCRHRHWTKAMISFAKNPALFKTEEFKAVEFNTNSKLVAWEADGKRKIARQVADVINGTNNLVAVKIERDGIYVITESEGTFSPESDDWEPYIELVPFKKSSA